MGNSERKILVTDDDQVFRTVARSALESRSFEVFEAGDGEAAIAVIGGHRLDLLLLDLDMPKVDGFQVIENVRSNPESRHLPIMVVTSRNDFSDIERAFELGATSFTVKPIDWNLLIHQINFVLRSSKMDIALRQAKKDVEAVSSYKTNLLSIISHELRTPVHAITGYSDLLLSKSDLAGEDSDSAQYLTELGAAANRLNRSLNDIFFLAGAIETGLRLQEDEYVIESMLEDIYAAWRPNAVAKNLDFQLKNFVRKNIELKCDQIMFFRAFGNLIGNAIKFSPSDSSVTLQAGLASNGDFVCSVADEGSGIHPEVLSEIQDLFSQSDMSATRPVEGLGLGLSICKAIAEQHGGRIIIRPGDDEGTIAELIMPAERVKPDLDYAKNSKHEVHHAAVA